MDVLSWLVLLLSFRLYCHVVYSQTVALGAACADHCRHDMRAVACAVYACEPRHGRGCYKRICSPVSASEKGGFHHCSVGTEIASPHHSVNLRQPLAACLYGACNNKSAAVMRGVGWYLHHLRRRVLEHTFGVRVQGEPDRGCGVAPGLALEVVNPAAEPVRAFVW